MSARVTKVNPREVTFKTRGGTDTRTVWDGYAAKCDPCTWAYETPYLMTARVKAANHNDQHHREG